MKKNVEVKELTLSYFKGAKSLQIGFSHITNIYGDNSTYKSTLFDGFDWLLFGKNANGESDTKFSIKTYDLNNKVIEKVDHSVEGVIVVNGEEITIKRILRENWQKKRGALESEFTGNETLYFWNEVPKSKKEYQDKVKEILDETVFKLITDPLAFNGMHWEKQREILISIIGNVSDTELAQGNKDFEALLEKLSNKDLEEYKKELAAKRLRLNNEIKAIPTRIDEQIKSKPEEQNFSELLLKRQEIQLQIEKIDSKTEDRNKSAEKSNQKRTEDSNRIYELKTGNQNIELEIKKEINNRPQPKNPLIELEYAIDEKRTQHLSANRLFENLNNDLTNYEIDLDKVSTAKNKKGEEWDKENATDIKFDQGSFDCPTCKRPLDASDIDKEKENMLSDFKEDKKSSLEIINREGQQLAKRETEIKTEIAGLKERISKGSEKLEQLLTEISQLQYEIDQEKAKPKEALQHPDDILKDELLQNSQYRANLVQIVAIEKLMVEAVTVSFGELKANKTKLEWDLIVVQKLLDTQEQIEKIDARVKELDAEEKNYAQQIADIEQQQFVAQQFTIKKVESIEAKVNELFPVVKFKLFETQVNGSEVPTCKATYLGVDWNDVNTAGKINSGIEIINVLSNHYQVLAPIWIDNAESVTKFTETDSQLIKLIVSETDKKLIVK
jgi:exonuclease SbcC